MTFFQAVILGVLQGITEFFPVSSSGHLVLAQHFFGVDGDVLVFDIAVHFATLLAVVVVFRKQLLTIIGECVHGLKQVFSGGSSPVNVYHESPEIRIAAGIIVGTIPAVIIGLTLKDPIESLFHSLLPVYGTLAFTGIVLLLTFRLKDGNKSVGLGSGFFIGAAQALAILPGVSRSGMTISTGLFIGVDREKAGEFSFLLSIPIILAATAYAVKNYIEMDAQSLPLAIILAGMTSSFIAGWISLVFLMHVVKRGKLGWFGYYCLLVAVTGVILYAVTDRTVTVQNDTGGTMIHPTTIIRSSYDTAEQHIVFHEAAGKKRPLLVGLHTWSHDHTQEDVREELFSRCRERDWHCVYPEFRGPNNRPEACGSEGAVQDVLDAVKWGMETFDVNPNRIFLAGVSGGGYMALLAASKSPSTWTAVSTWVPISDLARWHSETSERKLKYAYDLEKVCGGRPGDSETVDAEYHRRSAFPVLWRAHIVPMDINAGIHDGHGGLFGGMGSVPVGHSIRAFNVLADASGNKGDMIGEDLIAYLEDEENMPSWGDPGDVFDPSYGRDIHLRRTSGLARLTIFEGGHEMLYDNAFSWFDAFQ